MWYKLTNPQETIEFIISTNDIHIFPNYFGETNLDSSSIHSSLRGHDYNYAYNMVLEIKKFISWSGCI